MPFRAPYGRLWWYAGDPQNYVPYQALLSDLLIPSATGREARHSDASLVQSIPRSIVLLKGW